jgi:hypothetical protein
VVPHEQTRLDTPRIRLATAALENRAGPAAPSPDGGSASGQENDAGGGGGGGGDMSELIASRLSAAATPQQVPIRKSSINQLHTG